MKKFYPEEYFKRSGYPFNPNDTQSTKSKTSSELHYFKNAPKNNNEKEDFNRFNEELIYPPMVPQQMGKGLVKSEVDRLSMASRSSQARSSNKSRRQVLSRMSAKSPGVPSRMSRISQKFIAKVHITAAEAVKMIAGGKFKKVIAYNSNGQVHIVRVIVEEEKKGDEVVQDEDVHLEENEILIYWDEPNQLYYDKDGNPVELAVEEEGALDVAQE